jgi:DNA-binding MarR family transcriptional regulator
VTARNDTTQRISLAWRELRRGAATTALRGHLIGRDSPTVEQSQLDALEILVASPAGSRMNEFADAMRVDPSTATRAITRLERLGLAERCVDPTDHRGVIARATPLGERTVRGILARRATGMERLLEPFSREDRLQFAEYLERLVASIDRVVSEFEAARGPTERR